MPLSDQEKRDILEAWMAGRGLLAVESIVAAREAEAARRAWEEGHESCDCMCHGITNTTGGPCYGCGNPYDDRDGDDE